jgi:hypothetical protein
MSVVDCSTKDVDRHIIVARILLQAGPLKPINDSQEHTQNYYQNKQTQSKYQIANQKPL